MRASFNVLSATAIGAGSVLAVCLYSIAFAQNAAQERLGPIPRDQRSGPAARDATPPVVQRDATEFIRSGRRLLNFEPRIVGGVPAPIGAYPWQVSIGIANAPPSVGHFCGGSIIAANWIVTAAHCVDGTTQPASIQILYGTNFLSQPGRIAKVAEIIVHENWNKQSFDYDIAVIRTVETLESTPIKLVQPGEAAGLVPVGVLATVTGWGLTQAGGNISDVLQHVGVQVTSNDVCNGPTSYSGAITARMLCAGFATGGKDSCQGDSGGPFVVVDKRGGYALAGVVSWGEGCARPNKYGVYSRISELGGWVAQKAK